MDDNEIKYAANAIAAMRGKAPQERRAASRLLDVDRTLEQLEFARALREFDEMSGDLPAAKSVCTVPRGRSSGHIVKPCADASRFTINSKQAAA